MTYIWHGSQIYASMSVIRFGGFLADTRKDAGREHGLVVDRTYLPFELVERIDNSIGATQEDADALLEHRDNESPQQRLNRLLRIVLGTDDPAEPNEHVRIGLLRMNGGDQQGTFRRLLQPPYTETKLRNAKILARFTTLTNLDLTFIKIDDEGARALAANTTITKLDLMSSSIGDEGARALATNTAMKSVV